MQAAQSLKEFSKYTRNTLGVREIYAMKANMHYLGIDDKIIVENAGLGIAHALRAHHGQKILFVCGKGGKGALGMNAALHTMGIADVSVVLVRSSGAPIKNEAAAFNHRILSMIMPIEEIDENGIGKLERLAKSADVVVEALIGIGLRGRPTKFVVEAIRAINSAGKHVISIEVPAGINTDTGLPNIASVKADELFGIYKNRAMRQCKKPRCKLTIIDSGIPDALELIAGPGDVMLATEPRSIRANKYTIRTLVAKAFNNAMALGVHAGIYDKGVTEKLLAKAASHASALNNLTGKA